MRTCKTAARIAALCCAVLTTTVFVGGQVGLASQYTKEADDLLAAKRAVFAQTANAPMRSKSATWCNYGWSG